MVSFIEASHNNNVVTATATSINKTSNNSINHYRLFFFIFSYRYFFEKFHKAARAAFPNAKLVFDTLDFHFVRTEGAQSLHLMSMYCNHAVHCDRFAKTKRQIPHSRTTDQTNKIAVNLS